MGIDSQLASKRRGVGEGGEVEKPRHGPGKPGKEVVVLGIGVEKFGRNESQCRESCIEGVWEKLRMGERERRRTT